MSARSTMVDVPTSVLIQLNPLSVHVRLATHLGRMKDHALVNMLTQCKVTDVGLTFKVVCGLFGTCNVWHLKYT